MKRVLFVCLGNICRSPTAEAVFRHQLQQQHLQHLVTCDSAGTSREHAGDSPDPRASKAARVRGYDMTALRARQVAAQDFETFDLILAMDNSNLANLRRLAPASLQHKLKLFLEFGSGKETEVPDPYYGGAEGFNRVLDLVEDASAGLLNHLRQSLSP